MIISYKYENDIYDLPDNLRILRLIDGYDNSDGDIFKGLIKSLPKQLKLLQLPKTYNISNIKVDMSEFDMKYIGNSIIFKK